MMQRRTFLALSTSSLAAMLLSRCASGEASSPSSTQFTSQDGRVEVSLTAQESSVSLNGRSASLLTFNNQLPGPRIEANAGDTVRIHFTNQLSTSTNLHFHGLHIPPTGTADNVFLDVPSGESFTYEFTLSPDHPAGTFWYHPHLHGRVAEQVSGGLAGLFIIRGELDSIPEVQAAQEEFLVLQDFEIGDNGELVEPIHMFQMWGREGSTIAGNGQVMPQVSIPSQGLLRLRILNASPSRFYRLQIPDHPLHLIATDGGSITAPITVSELLLTPGERAEVLIQGDRSGGDYPLLNLPYDRGIMGMMRGMRNDPNFGTEPQPIATLTYQESSASSLALPSQLIEVPELPEPSRTRQFVLNHGMGHHRDMAFLINGQAFQHHRIDVQVPLGTVEDWEIINAGGMDHPFHVHVNSFQVISRNGVPERDRTWKDTVLVRRQETVRIRIPFRDYPGLTVYHCHILDHEDKGMMGLLEMTET